MVTGKLSHVIYFTVTKTNIADTQLERIGSRITEGVGLIIDHAKHTVAVYLNSEVTMTYWRIGKYIASELDVIGDEKYGSKIVATMSQQLTWSHFIPKFISLRTN